MSNRASRLVVLLPGLACGQLVHAGPPPATPPPTPTTLPTGGNVVAGNATLNQSSSSGGAVLNVDQTTSRAIIDWTTFNIGSAAQVNFLQPGTSSATLNRVLDSSPSQIFGEINAIGQVFLTNPNGVYFGKSASVNVGGLTATTSSISDADFMSGNITFKRNGATGSVDNEGELQASLGGYIALLAPEVRNGGVIVARMGTVAMAAGDSITLEFDGGHLTGIAAQASTLAALVDNQSAVIAPGGLVILSAKAADALLGGVVNNSGSIEATGLASKGGRIVLEASSNITNSGTISANAGADGSPAGSITVAAPSISNSGTIAASAAPVTLSLAAVQGGSIALSAINLTQTATGLLDVSGVSGGRVTLTDTSDANIAGRIEAGADTNSLAPGRAGAASGTLVSASMPAGEGGLIAITAGQNVTLQDALLDASGSGGGGQIQLQGGSPAPGDPPGEPPAVVLLGASQLNASSRRGKGGSVVVTGADVSLLDTSAIDASGATGGGNVFVGGGFRGQNPSIANAQATTVGSGTKIDASATQAGDGGEVVVWSEQQTIFAGDIEARGGAVSGSGGTLEVSGTKLEFTGSVNAGAPHGTGGSLLLDPQDIQVVTGGTDSVANETFATNPGSASTIDPSTITAITNTGTAVTLQANDDITINSAIQTVVSAGAGGALTFQAGRNITVNASVISDNGNITFSLNNNNANATYRNSGAATFNNNSVIAAGTGAVTITMGSLGTSGNITTGHITAGSLTINDSGTTAGTSIDLDDTSLTSTLSIAASSANPNLTNNTGTIAVRGVSTINVGTGNITITNPFTDFTTLGMTANAVNLYNDFALQFATTNVSTLTVTTEGPMASTGAVQVSGAANLTAAYGGFGYADPYINLTNSGNHFGNLTISVPSTGGGNTGGWASITDSGASNIISSDTAWYFNLQAGGAITTGPITAGYNVTLATTNGTVTTSTTSGSSLSVTATGNVSLGATTATDLTVSTTGAITNTAAQTISRQTTLTAGSTGNITLDNAGNSFDFLQIVSADNVTIVDTSGVTFGSWVNYGGFTSHIYGNLSLTAGGDIVQVGNSYTDGYSAIEVDGTATFIANNPSAPINLYLGTTNPFGGYPGESNNFAGTVTLGRDNTNTGFSIVEIRNTASAAAVLAGLTSVGTLSNVYLSFDNAPAVSLPGMTVTGNLYVWAPSVANTASTPSNVISETGAISAGVATFQTATTGDINLGTYSNTFTDFGVVQARNVTMLNSGPVVLYASPGYNQTIYGNYTITADGNISDTNQSIYVQSGTASFNAGTGDVTLTRPNFWNIVEFPSADNVTLYPYYSVILGNSTISGTLTISSYNNNETITQSAGTAIDMTTSSAVATFENMTGGVTLANSGNVFGPIAISNIGALSIAENNAITQASAWGDTNSVTLATSNDQAITLNQSGNYLGPLTVTQYNNGASSAAAVYIENNNSAVGLTQGSAWTTAGATTLNSSYSINLNNPNNVLGPLQVIASPGSTNGAASIVAIYAKNTAGTDAISDVGAAGAWSTGTGEAVELVAYDTTASTAGGGNITLTNTANVLGELYIKATNVTITENSNIIDGPSVNNWDGAADSGWATTGTTSLVVANPAGKSITLSNLDNLIGPVALSTTGTAGTLNSVLVTNDQNLTQSGVWNVGAAPVTLDSRTSAVVLTNTGNVMGNISITTENGTPSAVTIAENATITEGSAWILTGVPVTLTAASGNAITLTNTSNIMGNLTVTGGTVSITENANITQGGAWTTTGTTTLAPTGTIALTNANNVLGPIAIGGAPTAVSITEAANITQAAAWVEPSAPFTLNSGATSDILLSQASNQLGALTLTGRNATVTENNSAGITGGGAWNISGTTTLTAGTANPIELNGTPSTNLGTVVINSASGGDIYTVGAVNFGTSTIASGGILTVSAGGAITQTGAITTPWLHLIGTGYATLNNAGNDINTLAAGFSGGALSFTNSGDFAIGVIGGTSGITINANNVTLTSVNGTITGLVNVNPGSSSLTVSTGTALSLPQMTIAGAQSYTASTVSGAGITLTSGIISTGAGAITFNSPVTLATDLAVQSANSPINFASTVAGAGYQLNVNAGTGTIQFAQAVAGLGATGDASAALTLESSGANFASTLSANNGLAITGPVTFNDVVTLADGNAASVFAGLVTLGKVGGMTLSAYNGMTFDGGVLLQNGPATIEANNSPLTFQTAGTVSGPYALTLDSGTATLTGLDRMGSTLTGLTVTAFSPSIPAAGVSIAGPQTYTATSGSGITLNGNVTSTAGGAITFNDPVTVGAAVTVASSNSPVIFGSSVDGNKNLTVNAGSSSTTFTGAVGGIAPVGSGTGAALTLAGTGTTTFDSTVQTLSGIAATGPVVFDGNVTLGDGDTGSTFSALVTSGGGGGNTISGYGGLAFDGGLTLTGGGVGVISNGTTISFGGAVTGAENLTLNALAGGAGTVTGLSEIGSSSNLTGLGITAQTLSLPSTGLAVAGPMSFTAAGGITLNGTVGNSTSPATGQITFTGPVTLATGAISVASTNAPITFGGTVDGGESLSVNSGTGKTTFAGVVGGGTPLNNLTVASGSPTAINNAGITTTGAQTYGGAVTLGTNTTLAGDDITFGGTLDGAYALTVNDTGRTTFAGVVGGVAPLASLYVNAPDAVTIDTSAITTTGAQTYIGAVTLGSNVTFNGPNITFEDTVDGNYTLTANVGSGTLAFQGAVGGVTPLAALTASGGTVTANAIATTGAQNYTALVGLTLGGSLTTSDNSVTITGPTTLGGNVTIATSGGAIDFFGSGSTIDGGHALTLTAGTGDITLSGTVGGVTPLTAFTASGYDLTMTDVTTVNDANQTYTALDNITLTQSRTVGAPISFTADADGDGHGSFILLTGVSLTATNSALSVTAADIDLQGSSTLSSGAGVITITATDTRNLYVGGSTTGISGQMTITSGELSRISTSGGLTLQTAGSGWIEVNGITSLESQSITGPLTLNAQGTGNISFITAPSTFAAVTADASGGTINLGVDLTTAGNVEFVTPVDIAAAVTVNSGGGNISFDNTLGVANDLILATGGGVLTFGQQVDNIGTLTLNLSGGSIVGLDELQSSLTGLTVNGTASITLPALTIDGPQVYNTGAITATGNLTGIGLAFNNSVNVVPGSGGALTFNSGTGTLAFNGSTSFTGGASFNANSVTLIGDAITFAQAVTGTGSLTLEPYTSSNNISVGGSAATPGLDLTAANLAWLPLGTLSSLTIGSQSGTGALDVAGALNISSTALTLNGGGGITQSGGSVTCGPLTLYAAGNAITLTNSANAFGAVAIGGTPASVSLTNSLNITQLGAAAWNLGSAPLTLNAGTHDITLNNAGNTFGTLIFNADNVSVSEAADTTIGASTATGNLTVNSSGAIAVSGALDVTGNVSLTAGGEVTQSAPLTIGGNLTVSTSVAAGDVTLDNSGASATTIGNTNVGGNYTLTAADEAVTQAASTNVQVVGNLTITAVSADLSAIANLVGGTTTLPASNVTTVVEAGVITLPGGTYTGDFTVISENVGRSFGNAVIHGNAIVLDNSSNNIGGTISVSASPPTVTLSNEVQTGIIQQGGSSLSVAGTASFTAQASSAGSLGVNLTNTGNSFSTLQANAGTVNIANSSTSLTTLASSTATTSFSLTAAGAVAQTGPIATPALSINAAGSVTLNNAANVVDSLSVSSGGNPISFVNDGHLSISSLDAGGSTVSLTTGAGGNLTQTGAIQNVSALSTTVAGGAVLTNTGNSIQSLAASTAGSGFQLYNNAALSIAGTVSTAAGDLTLQAVGDLTLASGGVLQATTGNVYVSTEGAGNFINDASAGASALVVGSGDRWLVYSDIPDLVSGPHTIKGGLTSSFRLYNETYETDSPGEVSQAGDGFIYDYPTPTLTVSAVINGTPSHTYGNTPTATLGYSVTGFVDSEDNAGNVLTVGNVTFNTTLSNSMNAGAYTVLYTGGITANINYNLTASGTGPTYTVNPAVLTYTANSASTPYGSAIPALSGTLSGFKLGQDASVLTGSPTWTTTATSSSNAGQYPITGGGYTSNGNYTFAQAAGNATALTIGTLGLTITAADDAITYNGTNFSGGNGVSYSGFVNGQDASSLGGALTYSGNSQGARNAGTYAITPGGLTSSNYAITFDNGTLTIVQANLSLTTSNVTKTYDGALSAAGSAQVTNGTQLFGSDSLSGGTFAFTNANAGSGDKTVTVSGVTVSDGNGGGNYNVTYVNNTTSTINPENVTVSTSNVVKTYNGTLSASGTPVLVSGTLYHNASNDGALDSLSGGTFAFTNANAGSGDKTVTVGGVTVNDGNDGGNYNVTYANNTTSTINPEGLTVSAANVTKTYDGTLSASSTLVLRSGTLYTNASNGGAQDLLSGGTFAFTNANAGSGDKTVTVSGVTVNDGNDGGNYSITYANNTTSTINPASLTVGTANVTKTYDGSLSGTSTPLLLSGTLYSNASNGGAQDSLSGGTYTFTNANAGSGDKTVTVSGVTVSDGNDGGNYTVSYVNNTASTINPENVTVSTSNVVKTYNGTLSASGTPVLVSGTLYHNASNDGVLDSLSGGTYAFTNANAGSGDKTVTVGGVTVNDGNDGGNYTVSYVNNTASTINPEGLTVSAANVTKTYDGTLSASSTLVLQSGTLYTNVSNGSTQDTLSGGTFAFTNANAGSGDKTVTVSGVTANDGNDGGNYSITYANNTTSTINPASLTVGTANITKTYDGALSGSSTPLLLSGTLYSNASNGGVQDSLSGGTYTFTNANAGSGDKTVAVSAVTVNDGNDGGNYNVTYVNNTTSTINPENLTVSTSSVVKTYNGALSASGTPVAVTGTLYHNASNDGVLDSLSGGTYAFTNANAGSGDKTVTVGGVTVNDGNDGGNYNVTYANNTTSTINPEGLTVTAANVTKTYNGTLSASSTLVLQSGTLYHNASNDGVLDILSGGTYAFTNANAGSGDKTVTVSGVTVNDGNDGGNYSITYANNTTSTISPASLSVSTSNVAKTYNGTLSASGTPVVVSGTLYNNASDGGTLDSLSGGTYAFTNANAGSGDKTVTVSAVTVNDGNDGGNYNVTYVNNTASTINPENLTVSTSNVAKAYNGTLTASGTPVAVSGTLYHNASNGGVLDSLSGGTYAFTNANAGSGDKTVTVSGVTVNDGNDGGNYNVTYANNTTSTINPEGLTVSTSDVVKTYNGTLSASGTPVLVSGTLYHNASNDGVLDSLSGGTYAFTNANAGSGDKTVTVSGITVNDGNDGGNYSITYANNTTSTINPAGLTVGTANVTRTYNGTLSASSTPLLLSGTLYSNASNGDAQDTLSGGTFAFTNANAGSGDKTVTVSGVTVNDGNDGGNYSITYANNTASTINPASLTVGTANMTKTYDGALSASGTPVAVSGTLYSNVSNGGAQDTLSGGTYAFTNANAGSGDKTVTVSAVTVNDGNDGGNYNVTYANNTTSTINPENLTVSTSNVVKTYNGTLTAIGTPVAVSGTLYHNVSNDGVLDSLGGGTYAFTNANAGSGDKTVTVSGITVNDGNDGGNYTVSYVNNTTSTINPEGLTVSAANVTKTYNGTLSANSTLVLQSGTLYSNVSNGDAQDTLSGGTFAFTNANAGSGDKTVAVSGVTVSDGNDGGNYSITYANNTTSTVNPASLTVGTANVIKTYNGTLSGSSTPLLLSGTLYNNVSNGGAQDSLSGGTYTFSNANAGSGDKSVAVSAVTVNDGNDGGNYNVTYVNNTTSTINPENVTVSSANVVKTYNGTLTASGTPVEVSGTLYSNASNGGAQDTLGGGTYAFTNANAGSGDKTVTVSGITVNDGNDGGNYTVSYVNNTTSTINPEGLTISAANVTKTYNGTLSANSSLVLQSGTLYSNVSNGGAQDTLSGSTFAFTNANAGSGDKAVAVSGVTVNDGNGGGNYRITYANNTTSTIDPASLTVGTANVTKTYDGTTAASGEPEVVSGQLYENASNGGVQDGLNGGTYAFTNPNAGSGDKTVTVSGVTVNDGNGGGNYNVTYVNNTTSTITPRPLTVSATGTNKVYDGTDAATVTLSDTPITGDIVDATYASATFNDPNAGGNKFIGVTGITLSGADAANYSANATATAFATITPAALTVVATGQSKPYDGTTLATVTLTDNVPPGAQVVIADQSATFANPTVGNGKIITVTGISIAGGADAGDYMVADSSTTTTGNITAVNTSSPGSSSGSSSAPDSSSGTWSLPPVIPQPVPPTVPVTPPAVSNLTLPGGFGVQLVSNTTDTTTAVADNTQNAGSDAGAEQHAVSAGGTATGAGSSQSSAGAASAQLASTGATGAGTAGAGVAAIAGATLADSVDVGVNTDGATGEGRAGSAAPGDDVRTKSADTNQQISISVADTVNEPLVGIVKVTVPRSIVESVTRFHFPLPPTVRAAVKDQNISVTQISGKPLPKWLSYQAKTRMFEATAVPADDALPLELVVHSGAQNWAVLISERNGP